MRVYLATGVTVTRGAHRPLWLPPFDTSCDGVFDVKFDSSDESRDVRLRCCCLAVAGLPVCLPLCIPRAVALPGSRCLSRLKPASSCALAVSRLPGASVLLHGTASVAVARPL